MFEVLLQAGKALEAGELDQAEESYWQIVELDPSNAIGNPRACPKSCRALSRTALQK